MDRNELQLNKEKKKKNKSGKRRRDISISKLIVLGWKLVFVTSYLSVGEEAEIRNSFSRLIMNVT